MNIQVDEHDAVPVYSQIATQIRGLIIDGLLAAETKLPSLRELARQLGVSSTTVHTAYEILAAEALIELRPGSGTVVTKFPGVAAGTNLRSRDEMDSGIDDIPLMSWDLYKFRSEFFLVPQSQSPAREMIRFIQASPDPSLFPFDRIKQTVTRMLWNPQEAFFDRGHPQGYLPLVEYLEKYMALAGVPMAEGANDIIVTNGFQRALSVTLRLLLRPGEKVAVEAPTYSAILNLLLAERIEFVPIPMEADGMDTEYLARVLRRDDIRLVITIPTYHNPTGITMSQAKRAQLIRLAARYKLPLIEDDWGRMLRYDGKASPPLKAMDAGGHVIHIGTFSKCFLPGLRIGWITCPANLAITLVRAKLAADQSDSFFLQALMHEFIANGYLAAHLRKSIKEYRKRRDAMVAALRAHLPAGCSFVTPQGGFSIWVKLPKGIYSLPLLTLARQAGVEFLPSAYCMPDRRDATALRLTFSRTPLDIIPTGVELLCGVIKRCMSHPDLLDLEAESIEELPK
jgi:DNA-binding transcriptional MocR family regulator